MKPAPFEYHAPDSLDGALSLLAHADGDTKIISGGQSLLPLMNLRLSRPEALIDIERLPELRGIRVDETSIRIGATTTHAQIEHSTELAAACPLLPVAARHIGHAAIRTRGTLGGSLAHADPSAEWPTVMSLLDARFCLRSEQRGSHWVPARQFFKTFFTTALEPDDVLVEIEISRTEPGVRWAFHEFARQSGAFAIVTATAIASVEPDSTVSKIALAVGGCGATPRTYTDGQLTLLGAPLSETTIKAAARTLVADTDPLTDVHATSADRRQIVQALIERTLRDLGAPASTTRDMTR